MAEDSPSRAGSKRRCLGQKRPGKTVGAGDYLGLLASEPFRLFFPAGLCVGVIAVLLWPLFYAGWWTAYPAVTHSRLMITGFVAAFAVGFMGTAGPRFLSSPPLHPAELAALFAFYLAAVGAHLLDQPLFGDVAFLGLLCVFLLAMAIRVVHRGSDPPAGVVLAGMGLLCALAGALLLATEPRVDASPFRFWVARLLLHEGFVLLPVMGIGSFLFPRFFGGRGGKAPGAPGSSVPLALVAGLVVIAAIVADASGYPLAGGLLRAVAAGGYLLYSVPELWRKGRGVDTLAWCVRVAFVSIVVGLVAAAFLPAQRVGLDHLVFVSGYGLLVLTVAGRVLFGHAGRLSEIAGKCRPLRWILWLAILAATTRAVADFVFKIRVSHHIYAALLWFAIAVIWAWVFLPNVRRVEEE